MPRLPRFDAPGIWIHIFNRGIARRPIFETQADVRYFLACLARAVRRGELEIHAYCIMTTHFHLLVRSPTGQVSVAMQRVMNAYVRYYNRSRRRDGPLFRARYGARVVGSIVYRRVLVRYIDRNPVRARLAAAPWTFPYASAWHYARPRRPRWLATDWVDDVVSRSGHTPGQGGYEATFGRPWTEAEAGLVRRRMQVAAPTEDALDDLIDAAPPQVLAWMRYKAEIADGRGLALPSADPRSVQTVLTEARANEPAWRHRTDGGRYKEAWPLVEAYMLRKIAALTWTEIGRHLGIDAAMARRRAGSAAKRIESDDVFGERVARLARAVLDRAHGGANRS